MHRVIAVALLFFLHLGCVECREGWKTYGNGYFVYETRTDFNSRKELKIKGAFSTMPNITTRNTLLAVYDANGQFTFQIMVAKSSLYVAYQNGMYTEEKQWSAPGVSDGCAYNFTATVAQESKSASIFVYSIRIDIAALSSTAFILPNLNASWNYTAIKLKIGGNYIDPVAGHFFEGCLSNIIFNGTDIISKYFTEFPSNINPVRGKKVFVKNGHRFSNVSESCNDVIRPTAAPHSTGATSTKATSTKATSTNAIKTNPSTAVNATSIHTSSKPGSDGNANQVIPANLLFCMLVVFYFI